MVWEKELWPEWQIECDIGSGASGTVYRIKREDIGGTYYSALKVISFPRSRNEYLALQNMHMSDEQISEYYHQRAIEVAREVAVMEKLKGHTNIVTYEDHKIVSHKNGYGWNVLIRMELLTSLPNYLETHVINEKEVCRLGIEICNALILCEKQNIIHRDIKPGNIFVSDYGDYKLGDFSLAKYVELKTESAKPRGTYAYMAPEVYRGQEYDFTIDIYSLGLILYRLLNRGRGPYQPLPPEALTSDIIESANRKRLCSESFPKPVDASVVMASIIAKACAYDPAKRYQNAADLQKALMRCSSSSSAINATKQISYYLKKAAAVLQDSYDELFEDEETDENETTGITDFNQFPDLSRPSVHIRYSNNKPNIQDDTTGASDHRTMNDFFAPPGDL